jgi:hypothetical protein
MWHIRVPRVDSRHPPILRYIRVATHLPIRGYKRVEVDSRHLLILGSMWFFSSRLLMVTGSVAELEAVPKAVTRALPMFATNLPVKIY